MTDGGPLSTPPPRPPSAVRPATRASPVTARGQPLAAARPECQDAWRLLPAPGAGGAASWRGLRGRVWGGGPLPSGPGCVMWLPTPQASPSLSPITTMNSLRKSKARSDAEPLGSRRHFAFRRSHPPMAQLGKLRPEPGGCRTQVAPGFWLSKATRTPWLSGGWEEPAQRGSHLTSSACATLCLSRPTCKVGVM